MVGRHDEECACCKDRKAFERKEREDMRKYGWIAHVVGSDDKTAPFGFNYHTHGLPQKFKGAYDVQIVLPLPPKLAHRLAINYIALLAEGQRIDPGQVCSKIVRGMDVKLVVVKECGRKVLRMILPDSAGFWEKEKADPKFARQWEGVR